mmetsp:Transcript_48166/g.61765  ORF Transcript_48166/g.61765 Transcript_48166/m.61765 type:complete len:115 (+) Transcript_48166:13-357(+)
MSPSSPFHFSSTMQNEEGDIVDLYIPRKCSWTNSLIEASDKASIQLNVADIDPATGRFLGDVKTYAINGYIRDHVRNTLLILFVVHVYYHTMLKLITPDNLVVIWSFSVSVCLV